VVRRQVLAALAEAIEAGNDDAARAAIERTEVLLRGAARRRLERALIDAALVSNEGNTFHDPEAARHVQRVAALELAGVPIDPTNRERVAETYAKLPRVTPRRAPIAAIALVATLVLLAGSAVAFGLLRGEAAPPRRGPRTAEAYVRALPPPVAGAFANGGVPFGDPAIEEMLINELTDFVIATDRARNHDRVSEQTALLGKLRDHPAITARGTGLATAWNELLQIMDRFATDHMLAGKVLKELGRELRGKVREVSDQLAAAGIGLYLEGYLRTSGDRASIVVYTYKVEEVVFVRAGSDKRRVLSLRRLDQLNRSWALLGMQSEELGDPVVLLDKIDEHVASKVLPLLADGATYDLGDWDEAASLAAIVGRSVRDEILAGYGADAPRVKQVAALLVERGKLVEHWRDVLKPSGMRLARLESLYLPESLFETLAKRIPANELERARDIDAKLGELEAGKIAGRAHELIAATVRRHEAQHGVDADRDEPLRYPPRLEEYLGPELDEDSFPRRSVERARNELSAYLSQIANDPATARYTLWHVARAVFDRGMWGSAESYAGVLIIEGLARQLGVTAAQPLIEHRSIDRRKLLAPALALASAPPEKLRAAARSLWLELYEEPFVPIVDM
jgi:hypothetical protein